MELKAHIVAPTEGMRVVPAHPQREWMNETLLPFKDGEEPKGKGFANRCLPMLMANQIGWEVRTTAGYAFTPIPGGNHVSIVISDSPLPFPAGPKNNFSHNIVTWSVPWVFQTPEGWDLLIVPPLNHIMPEGVTVLAGLVETDHAHQTFTLNWKLTGGIYVAPDTPIATLIPYPTPLLDGWLLTEDEEVPERFPEFIERRSESVDYTGEAFGRWDKDYWNEAKRRKIGK